MKRITLLILLLATSSAFADAFQPWARRDQRVDYIGAAADSKPIQGVKRGSKLIEYDTGNSYRWKGSEERGSTSDWQELYDPVSLGTKLAFERNEDSTTGTGYGVFSEECAMSAEIDLSNNASTTVYPGPAILCGYRMVVTIGTAAATIDDNATAKMTLPVAWPVGEHHVEGAIFEESLVVNPADATTGTLQLRYRPLDSEVTWP